MKRYVALGSSMAAGPGIRPPAAGAPRWAGRSARNYAHLVADRLNLHLGREFVDVTFSGATTAHVLADRQHGQPPQINALDGSESLVTITIGGNDVGYVPLLMAASLPHAARRLPLLGGRISELLDRDARDRALADVFDSLCAVGNAVRERATDARIFFVDYRRSCRRTVRRLRGCRERTPIWAGVWPRPSNDSRPRRQRRADARSSAPRRPAGNITLGRLAHGPRNPVCRYRVGRPRCTPTLPGCARWPNCC